MGKTTPPNENVTAESASPANPLCGVEGVLKFFVVLRLYIVPALYVATTLASFRQIPNMAKEPFALIFSFLIPTVVTGLFVWKWVQISRLLRDIKPMAVQATKKWLKLSLGWGIMSALLFSLPDLHTEESQGALIGSVMINLISFALWYAYFSVSKRVKATYPDWNQ